MPEAGAAKRSHAEGMDSWLVRLTTLPYIDAVMPMAERLLFGVMVYCSIYVLVLQLCGY